MTLERITEMNIDYAIQIQEELFPGMRVPAMSTSCFMKMAHVSA